jgi:segregation and condensation protein B
MLRLVRDQETTVKEREMTLVSEEEETPALPPLPVPSSRRRRRAEPAEAPEAQTPNAAMDTDGPVVAEADEPAPTAEESDAPADLGVLEAMLFATHHPLTNDRIRELMELKSAAAVRKAIQTLNFQYEQSGRCFRVEQVAGGYQLLSLPQYGDFLKKLHQREIDSKLTKAALETLAIIAYKQPILRAEVEAIRGVACGETIRNLMEKHLVRIAGRAEEPGRPILYGTTKRFLELFGLNNLKDLPQEKPGE